MCGQIPEERRYMYTRIRNDFFGERITVAGLITAQDLIAQLKGTAAWQAACCFQRPCSEAARRYFWMISPGTDVQNALQVPVNIVKSSGRDFVNAVLRPVGEGQNMPVHGPYELDSLEGM